MVLPFRIFQFKSLSTCIGGRIRIADRRVFQVIGNIIFAYFISKRNAAVRFRHFKAVYILIICIFLNASFLSCGSCIRNCCTEFRYIFKLDINRSGLFYIYGSSACELLIITISNLVLVCYTWKFSGYRQFTGWKHF